MQAPGSSAIQADEQAAPGSWRASGPYAETTVNARARRRRNRPLSRARPPGAGSRTGTSTAPTPATSNKSTPRPGGRPSSPRTGSGVPGRPPARPPGPAATAARATPRPASNVYSRRPTPVPPVRLVPRGVHSFRRATDMRRAPRAPSRMPRGRSALRYMILAPRLSRGDHPRARGAIHATFISRIYLSHDRAGESSDGGGRSRESSGGGGGARRGRS